MQQLLQGISRLKDYGRHPDTEKITTAAHQLEKAMHLKKI